MALAIKRLTVPAHRVAEASVARLEPFSGLPAYVSYLRRLHAFYREVEPGLFARLDRILPDASERRKLVRIEADLGILDPGFCPGARPYLRLRIASDAAAIGVAYVLEGKTLGSRFLLEEAERALGLSAGHGASFFAGYGARTGAMWTADRAALDAFVAARGQRTCVLDAARATFASFTSMMRA